MITREEALEYLQQSGMDQALIRHSLAAEAILRALAQQLGEDVEVWGVTGLLHDLDYPQTHEAPERHGLISAEQLAGKLPEEALQAIRAHNEMNGCQPASRFDYALRCGETVTGLIMAAALVRPTGMEGMQASSLKKKMKDKAFAASVSRANIKECAELGLELGDFLTLSIIAMTPLAGELGLNRTPAA